MTRALRIKEHLKSRTVRPSEAQLAVSNPTLDEKEYKITVDRNYFMIGEHNSQNEKFPKVVFLGDSVIEGTYAGEGNRITDHLNKWTTEDSARYEYLNAAYSGATTLHCMVSYLGKVMPMNPQHLFLFLGGIDATVVSYEDNFWTERKGATPFIAPPHEGPFKKSRREYKYREALILGMSSMCASLRTDFHLIIPPVSPKAQWHDRLKNFDASVSLRQEINAVTRKLASDYKIKVLDLDFSECKNADLFYDIEHLNSKGHEVVAKQIRRYIQSL